MPKTKCLKLYVGKPTDPDGVKAIATVSADHIVVCSQYVDLRDAENKLIATITWTSPVQVLEI